MTRKLVDFNSLLAVLNILVAGGVLIAFAVNGANEYIDQVTVVLAELLCIQTQAALLLERRRRDPFVLLLTFSMILYYELRILTLTAYPFSVVFQRYSYDVGDSNFALVFMLLANFCLYAGLLAVRSGSVGPVARGDWRATEPVRVVVLLCLAIVLGFVSGGLDADSLPRALSILSIFLNPGITVLMMLTYFFVFRASLGRGFALAIATLLIAEMAVHTLMGSRSALVGFLQSCMYVALALNGGIQFRRKFIYGGIALLPVLLLLLLATFTISTFNRANRESGGAFSLGSAVALAQQSSSLLSPESGLDLLLPPIFSRAGFFDYSAEVIAHRDEYADILNLSTYGKSIVDNLLTPGFDIYDQPKIANSLQFAYLGMGVPSKVAANEFYQSDQLGIYGESYALFGYGGLPVLFLATYLLKRVYVGLSSPNPFTLAAKRAVTLFVFMKLMDSFGIDWILIEMVPLIAAIFVYSLLFSGRRVRGPESPVGLPVHGG